MATGEIRAELPKEVKLDSLLDSTEVSEALALPNVHFHIRPVKENITQLSIMASC
jgi:hypothetical protein